jgi:hypothetical protein
MTNPTWNEGQFQRKLKLARQAARHPEQFEYLPGYEGMPLYALPTPWWRRVIRWFVYQRFIGSTMPTPIEYVPADARRRRGIRFRIVVSMTALAVACVVLAYWLPQEPAPAPNYVWFYFAFWPALAAIGTAFLSFLATGRPW